MAMQQSVKALAHSPQRPRRVCGRNIRVSSTVNVYRAVGELKLHSAASSVQLHG